MGKVLTWEEAKKLLEEQPRRLIIREDTGEVEVVFKSQIEAIEPGDTDLAGYTWNPPEGAEWTKHEAKVEYNGITHVLSLGGPKSPLLLGILNYCIQNNIRPEEIVGTKWRIKRVGNRYEITYLGKGDAQDENDSADEYYLKIKEAIESIKNEMPEYLKNGVAKDEFISGVVIKANMLGYTDITRDTVEKYFSKLMSDGVITEESGIVRG